MENLYLFTIHNRILMIKLQGHITYVNSPAFDSFARHIFHKPEFESVLIDLSETSGIDSTNLGILARIGDTSLRTWNKKAAIISVSPDITRTLESMGFEQIFLIVERREDGKQKLQPVPAVPDHDQAALAQTILEAHRELMKISKQNRDTFRSVVAFMEKDILRLKKKTDNAPGTE